MAAAVSTTTRPVGDSRVRVEVEVHPEAVARELEGAARALGRDLKMPGFRKGKVPPQVVLQRVGREAVLEEAVRQALPGWYEQAVNDAGVATVGDPRLDLSGLPAKGSPLEFSIEVGVRPVADLGEYRGLEVGRAEAEVSRDEVDAELERLRESLASLETVERPAERGDFVVLDFAGTVDGEPFEGAEARGFMLELGSERLVEGFEDQLAGAAAGDEREVRVTFPPDYQTESLAGREAVFATTVKEVKEKRLPEVGDELAAEAGGFDTLEELRADIESRLEESQQATIEGQFREAVVDAAAAAARIEVPQELVEAKAREMWRATAQRLEHQGLDPARYLQVVGKTEEQVIEEARPEAERALRRESVLAAVVEAEGIEVSDDELLESLRAAASAPGQPEPAEDQLRETLERARSRGRDRELREDIAMRKAVDLLVQEAKPIPVETAKARERLWTPENEPHAPAGTIWTPGS